MVASSIGGLTAEMFARVYPERVAGIVFVDAANSLISRVWRRGPEDHRAGVYRWHTGRFGVIRLLDPFGLGTDSEGARRSAAITYGARPWTATCAMARGLTAIQREFEQAPRSACRAAGRRVVRLERAAADAAIRRALHRCESDASAELEETHRAFAKRPHGTWKKVPDSTHLIADSQPDAVADTVFDLLDQLRRGGLQTRRSRRRPLERLLTQPVTDQRSDASEQRRHADSDGA